MQANRLLPAAILIALLGACTGLPTRTLSTPEPSAAPLALVEPTTPAASALPPADDNLNAVAWFQTSVEYRLIAGQTWRAALGQLDRAIKTPRWDALPREDRPLPMPAGLPLAVIVDIDETVLDNSPYQARLVRDRVAHGDAAWSDWVGEAAARPIPGSLEFARAAGARGVTIFYLSNRTVAQGPDTLRNLRQAGFPVAEDSQYLGAGTVVPNCETKGSDKGCRRQMVGRSHRVLMQVGDQLGDMVSIANNTPGGREAVVKPYLGWVGERWFVLPNPTYGSWEPALFNNAWSLPAAERRQQKLKALRY